MGEAEAEERRQQATTMAAISVPAVVSLAI